MSQPKGEEKGGAELCEKEDKTQKDAQHEPHAEHRSAKVEREKGNGHNRDMSQLRLVDRASSGLDSCSLYFPQGLHGMPTCTTCLMTATCRRSGPLERLHIFCKEQTWEVQSMRQRHKRVLRRSRLRSVQQQQPLAPGCRRFSLRRKHLRAVELWCIRVRLRRRSVGCDCDT